MELSIKENIILGLQTERYNKQTYSEVDEVSQLIQGHIIQMIKLIEFGQKHEEVLSLYGAGIKDDLMRQYAQVLFQTNLKHRMLGKILEKSQEVSDIRRYYGRW